MGELQYAVLRYAPSLVSGEKINLGVVFHYLETDYREFYSISRWSRVSAFDDTLNIAVLKDLMLDIKDEIGTRITNPQFNLKKYCTQYDSELFFDNCVSFYDVEDDTLSLRIEEIKQMYFQFEFDQKVRPSHGDQKKFLSRILTAKQVEHFKNYTQHGRFNAPITYDFIFGDYGVVFFNLNGSKINNNTLNKVKAWAWNSQNISNELKLIVLYDLDDESRPDAKPALDILATSATQMFNIHDGFSDVTALIEKLIC